MKIKKISLDKLFYNNKFALIFSLVISILLWLFVTSADTEDHPRAITNVPIEITLSDAAQADGLRVFNSVDQTATVYIKGNSLVVNQVNASDLKVVALSASAITSPNTYPLVLTAQKTDKRNLTAFSVVSVSPEQAIAVVDRYKEKTFQIQNLIQYPDDYKSDPSFFVGTPTLDNNTVTVSGPEKQVQQVNRVAFEYKVTETLKETKNFTADLVMYDANDNKITDSSLTLSIKQVGVSIPVLPREVLPLDAVFTNKPAGLSLGSSKISIDPKNIEVAGPASVLANLSAVSLAPIDFSKLSPATNSFEVDVSLPSTCRNLSNIPTARVTLDLSGFSTRKITVTNFKVKNLSPEKKAQIYTKKLNVTIIGPEEEISKLTENNLVAEIDLSDNSNFTGHTELPVTFSLSNASSSWVYGDYMVNLSVSGE
ncbi:MAG: CdaR family protein [Oscillospiraceae bacterium]|jgi:YbbR domain-containing protein|nr:CdaR family protein [Oscillospiraceae bacterium]